VRAWPLLVLAALLAGCGGGADSEGSAVEQFNTEHGAQGLKARFRKLPLMAGAQHRRLFGRRAVGDVTARQARRAADRDIDRALAKST
jgi:hypothetical protein